MLLLLHFSKVLAGNFIVPLYKSLNLNGPQSISKDVEPNLEPSVPDIFI